MYAQAGTVVCKTSVFSVARNHGSFPHPRGRAGAGPPPLKNSHLQSRAAFCHLRQGKRPASSAPSETRLILHPVPDDALPTVFFGADLMSTPQAPFTAPPPPAPGAPPQLNFLN